MALLTIRNIVKSYGLHRVLNNVSLILNAEERVGLVGANGVGKSTLLKITAGLIEADSGSIRLASQLELGYLPQVITGFDHQTLGDLINEALKRVRQLEQRLRQLEQQMPGLQGEALETTLAEYGETAEQFERAGGYETDYRVEQVMTGLGVNHILRDRRFSTLSGGEKSRAGLALLLLSSPDVLLLDEPTNHLDYAALAWLEDYLSRYRGAVLVVSHDRLFLNRTVNAIVEIDEHTRQSKRYSGNYDSYQQAKTQERLKWEADYVRQQEEIRALHIEAKETARSNRNYRAHTDNDKYIRNAKIAQHDHTVSKRVRLAEEKLRRILADPIQQPPAPLRFDPRFDPNALKGRLPIVVSNLSKSYGARCVLLDVSFTVGARSRIVLAGPNGAGKSTLIKLLAGTEQPDRGSIFINPAVRMGLLEQEIMTASSPSSATWQGGVDNTLFEVFKVGMDDYEEQALKTMLIRSGLFRYADFGKPLSGLSSGQRRKLQIARLIFSRANLLLLDEPTNDLSFDVLEALEEALQEFPGPVIAATHDRRFMQRFDGEIWELQEGHLVKHLGGYEEYLGTLKTYQPYPTTET
jgi:macrolide transport system ATP-binding/permease protein